MTGTAGEDVDGLDGAGESVKGVTAEFPEVDAEAAAIPYAISKAPTIAIAPIFLLFFIAYSFQ